MCCNMLYTCWEENDVSFLLITSALNSNTVSGITCLDSDLND